jgi:hypothetical protein
LLILKINKKMKKLIMILLCGMSLSACFKKPGCTEPRALNYDYNANENDGSCSFTTATFYAKYGYYSGIPINKIDVSIDGSYIGSISSVYPSGPGNCSATGTVAYELLDSDAHDWNTTVLLANGAMIYGSGTVSAASSMDCKKINVTN